MIFAYNPDEGLIAIKSYRDGFLTAEELAQNGAETWSSLIFFFADLTTENV